jgi:hypothetical protein
VSIKESDNLKKISILYIKINKLKMNIIVIKNESELKNVIEEINKFKSNRVLAESDFISIEKYNEENNKFTIIDKTNNLVYEVNKIYLFELNDLYIALDYKYNLCELNI